MYRGLDPVSVARTVSRRTRRGRPCYVFMSAKAGGLISMESYEEYKRALLLELDPRVVSYSEQPWTMELTSGEIRSSRDAFRPATADMRFYTPDFTVSLPGERVLIIEVKKALPSDERDEKYERAKRHCQEQGYEFLTLEGSGLSEELVRNSQYLVRTQAEYLKKQLPEIIERLIDLSLQRTCWTFAELAQVAPHGGFGVFVGIARGVLQADLTCDLLRGQRLIKPAQGDLTHLELGFV